MADVPARSSLTFTCGFRRDMTLSVVVAVPTTILVDRQGIIRKKVIGFEY